MSNVLTMTVGAMGSGKSYRRAAHFLVTDFLLRPNGIHFSNFPIDKKAVADYMHTYHGHARERTLERIQIIPKDILTKWCDEDSYTIDGEPHGPWNWFGSPSGPSYYDMSGGHFALDEAHNFVPQGGRMMLKHRKKWREWVGEVRHQGLTVEIISQTPEKIDVALRDVVGIRLQIENQETRRIPYFQFPMHDIYQLKAKFIDGYWSPRCVEVEKRPTMDANGRTCWEVTRIVSFWLDKELYKLYDSYNAPTAGGEGNKKVYEFEILNRKQMILWFLKRDWHGFVMPLFVLAICGYLLFGNGFSMIGGAWSYAGTWAGLGSNKPETEQVIQEKEKQEQAVKEVPLYQYEIDNEIITIKPEQVPLLIMENEQNKKLLESSYEKNQQSEKYINELEQKNKELTVSNVHIVALSKDSAWLSSGEILTIGDKLEWTEPIGQTLKEINHDKSFIRFSDDSFMRFGMPDNRKNSIPNWMEQAAGISRDIGQVASPGRSTNDTGGKSLQDYFNIGAGHAPADLPTLSVQGNTIESDMVSADRYRVSEHGSAGSNSNGSAGTRSKALGRESDREQRSLLPRTN